jgi:AcrR family transcriptional regulator
MRRRGTRVEQKERNRQALVDAAKTVFLRDGYHRASVEAIASEAGLTIGALYSQFGSKADLFLHLLDARIEERAAENERIAARASGVDGVRELLRVGVRDLKAQTAWSMLLIEFRAVAFRDPELNRRYAAAHARTVEQLAGALERVHENGGLRLAMPPPVMAEFFLAFGAGLALERAARPRSLPDDVLQVIVPGALGLTQEPSSDQRERSAS